MLNIPTPQNVGTVSDMRLDPVGLLDSVVKSNQPKFIFERSDPRAVLLSIQAYEGLMELVEDYRDNVRAQLLAAEDKSKVDWLTLVELEKKLGLKKSQK